MAKDYGDRLPSDADDTTPVSPTEGFSETDYTIQNPGAKAPAKDIPPFYPEVAPPNIPPAKRNTFSGAIIRENTKPNQFPRVFSILRQDGRTGTAYKYQLDEYKKHLPGDTVTLVESQKDDEWIIVSEGHSHALPWIAVHASADKITDAEFIVPFDTVDELFPVDDAFGGEGEVTLAGPGRLKAGRPGKAVYEVSYQITLECRDEGERCFDVTMEQTGGSDGSKTTAASWTYTVKEGETVIATDLNPLIEPSGEANPWTFGSVAPATKGWACVDSNGVVRIITCNHAINSNPCATA